MTDATRFQFNNPSVPKAYDEFFVPRLFEPWAKLLLEAADLRRGESVLDLATGPGTVAPLAAVRLGAEGRVVAIDIAQPMLDIAKAKAPPPAAAPIEYLNSPAAPVAAVGRRGHRLPRRSSLDSVVAHGARRRSGAGRAILRRDAGVARRRRACTRRSACHLRPYAGRNGAIVNGRKGHRCDDLQHHCRP